MEIIARINIDDKLVRERKSLSQAGRERERDDGCEEDKPSVLRIKMIKYREVWRCRKR